MWSMSDTIMFGTDEPSCSPVPLKIHAERQTRRRRPGRPPARGPGVHLPDEAALGPVEGGEYQVLPVTSIGSPLPFNGSSLESR